MRLRQYLIEAAQTLQKAGVDSPRLCAQVLVEKVLHLDRLACVMQAERQVQAHELQALNALLARRQAGRFLLRALRRLDGCDILIWKFAAYRRGNVHAGYYF